MTDRLLYFFVQFDHYRRIPLYAMKSECTQQTYPTKRALLWEYELNLFELITAEEREAAVAAFVELHLMRHGTLILE